MYNLDWWACYNLLLCSEVVIMGRCSRLSSILEVITPQPCADVLQQCLSSPGSPIKLLHSVPNQVQLVVVVHFILLHGSYHASKGICMLDMGPVALCCYIGLKLFSQAIHIKECHTWVVGYIRLEGS